MQSESYGNFLKEGDSYPEIKMMKRCYSRGCEPRRFQSLCGMDKRASVEYKRYTHRRSGPLNHCTHSLLCLQIHHTL